MKDNTMHLFKCTKQKIIQCTSGVRRNFSWGRFHSAV